MTAAATQPENVIAFSRASLLGPLHSLHLLTSIQNETAASV
jgi:hypothetical protein